MLTDFDNIIDRNVYPTLKWNSSDLEQHFGNDNVLPLWVADVDFQVPPVTQPVSCPEYLLGCGVSAKSQKMW